MVIPGYDGLRSFSRAQEPLLKAELRRSVAILFSAEPLAHGVSGRDGTRNGWRKS